MRDTLILLLIILILATCTARIPATLRRKLQYASRAFFGAILRQLPADELRYYYNMVKDLRNNSESANTLATTSRMSDTFPNGTALPAILGTAASTEDIRYDLGKNTAFYKALRDESWLIQTLVQELALRTPMLLSDTRFYPDKKNKYYICDSCQKLVTYKGQAIPFQGNFLHQGPRHLKDKEKEWLAGTWDATWLCVECLSEQYDCPVDFATRHLIGNFLESRQRAKAKYMCGRMING